MNNQTISGFLLFGWFHLFPKYLKEMVEDVVSGKLRIVLDLGKTTSEGQFNGIDAVVRGVEVSIRLKIVHANYLVYHANSIFTTARIRERWSSKYRTSKLPSKVYLITLILIKSGIFLICSHQLDEIK